MSLTQKFFDLNNGNQIPSISIIGTGTRWFKRPGSEHTFSDELVEQIKYALSLPGIIHIDAAECYGTYPELAKALKESSKPRSEIFITDKYSTQTKFTNDPIEGLNTGLKTLGLDYVDLYLIHSPFFDPEFKGSLTLEKVWKDMETLYKEGKAKSIGVSNFSVKNIEEILKIAGIKPQVNQIEFNAFLQNQTPGIVNYCQKNNIQLEAYSPLGPLQKRPENSNELPFYNYIDELASKYGKTDSQILLNWVYNRGILPITTSSKTQRIIDAQNIFSFNLTKDEVDTLTKLGLEQPALRIYWTNFYDKYNSEAQAS
ncbi:hypothetical protein Kpol_1020p13 [Vanderwaltozyma polyspora DSM 70294]|uniref:NADP-dependent oxidoreductase domain-containing protein n=1 Tax=Vanderwaltozyma polyspora (strain ATCC 22028 / DSM 70294 / BCRC 21397 / CBS 2163 / NBRC 10782 / NRRL Y-8283 / UCD 57-17) TaxID=436907 RepID=A7TLC4_VANPO|nr:uncharacterized protein Kpol_1020p13 [Vanderwaltozyma polyspora DSM 70294]EDO16905.1 hypothetical protein Kpol_1020p13 [Vanderwaltozyma polyspora DSM 70294]